MLAAHNTDALDVHEVSFSLLMLLLESLEVEGSMVQRLLKVLLAKVLPCFKAVLLVFFQFIVGVFESLVDNGDRLVRVHWQ